jgi:hypothetical protein
MFTRLLFVKFFKKRNENGWVLIVFFFLIFDWQQIFPDITLKDVQKKLT